MKYLIREVGWVYNDATYDNDSKYRTIEMFDSEEEAKEKKKDLDFEYFLDNLDFIHSYEPSKGYKKHKRDFKYKVKEYRSEEQHV